MTETTWDGLAIAADWPMGATVVLRRTDGLILLLHRASRGVDYEGDWAWTTPAGARQPGEPILPAAIREVAEEAGLAVDALTPIDLTGRWALFTAEVEVDAPVALVDPEHDRFDWVRPADAYPRIRPSLVADGIRRALAVPLTPLSFRPLRHTDFGAMVTWQNAGHVRPWWTDAVADVSEASQKYGPRIDGTAATRVDVILLDGEPIGFVQTTPLAADAEYRDVAGWVTDGGEHAVGIDYAIGAAGLVDQGLGTRMIWEYIHQIVLTRFPGTRYVVADPPARHIASIRACEKGGFRRIFDFTPEPDGPRHALCIWERTRILGA